MVDRNGSGKSSFAEAVEIALTGTNARWRDLTVEWKDGWRNLHSGSSPMVTLAMQAEGAEGRMTARRT